MAGRLLGGAFDIGPNLVKVAHTDEKEVALLGQDQDSEVQPCAEFQIPAEWSESDTTVGVWPPDGGLEAEHRLIDPGALLRGKPFVTTLKTRLEINHSPGFQGLSLPALRSSRMAVSSRWAARSTCLGVTPYSSHGLGGPKKKFQAASCSAAEKSLYRPVLTWARTISLTGSDSVILCRRISA